MKKHVGKIPMLASAHLMRLMVPMSVAEFDTSEDKVTDLASYRMAVPSLHVVLLMLSNPNYWIPEAYCRGHWCLQKGDLASFLADTQNKVSKSFKKYMSTLNNKYLPHHILKQKLFTKYFSRLVRSHYEIAPEVYRCFLDEEMVYTCAFFELGDSLSDAQCRKFSVIVDRLELPERPNILNIGCGWGSFERFIVRKSSFATITGLSISKNQVSWAAERNNEVLEHHEISRINLVVKDYVDYSAVGNFDAVTAIGMVEHVGQSGYQEFFSRAYNFLKPNGILLVHMIVKAESNIPTNSWIDKYIFPGGYSPSISELTRGAEGLGFRVKNIHIHHPCNYARTLREWRLNLHKNKENMRKIYVKSPGTRIDSFEYMFRQWEFYLAASEASFLVADSPLQIAQFVFEKYSPL